MPRLNRKTPKILTEDHREEISQKLKPTKTGVHAWYLMIDQKSGRPFFKNEEKGQSNWGLPLRDIYLDVGVSCVHHRGLKYFAACRQRFRIILLLSGP